MSLTIIKHGNDLNGGLYYPHSCNFPAFFTCSSTQAANYYDFKYLFKVYDESGEIFQIYKSPSKDLEGVFNPSKIIKSFLEEDLLSLDSLEYILYQKEYRVTVQEFYNTSLQGSEIDFDKSLGGNLSYNFTDSKLPYIIENNRVGEFLTNQTPDALFTQSLNTRASWLYTTDDNTQEIDWIEYWVTYRYTDGSYRKYAYKINKPSTYYFNANGSNIYSADESTIKLPLGFGNLKETTVDRIGYWIDPNDDDISNRVSDTQTAQPGIDSNVVATAERTRLDVQLFYDTSYISGKYSWDLSECSNKDITINWSNIYGGIDFFNFNQVKNENLSTKRKTYQHNSFDNDYYNSTERTNETTYSSEKEYEFSLRTKYLNKEEIDLLKGLWLTDNLIMYIDDVAYPIQSLVKSQTISDLERPEFVAYILKVKYSKIIR